MDRVVEFVGYLQQTSAGKQLSQSDQFAVASCLDTVVDKDMRVKGLPAVEILPERFEGSGGDSAAYRVRIHPDELSNEQLEDVVVDLLTHEELNSQVKQAGSEKRSPSDSAVLDSYKTIHEEQSTRFEQMGWDEAKGVLFKVLRERYKNKKEWEGVALISLEKIPAKERGKPRRELRQEFLYGMRHDRLVNILLGHNADGHLVQLEEYWGGRNWESLDLRQKVEVIRQVAEGAQYLHSLGVVHRDIKPGNVLIKGRKNLQAKLCDYSIIDSPSLEGQGVTSTSDGTVAGTIAYMAPEQGNRKPTKRSDIFSLGALLYHYATLLSPTPLPENPSLVEKTRQIIHREKKPYDPRACFPEDMDKKEQVLVNRLKLVMAGCLQRDEHLRYENVEHVKDDLQLVLEGKDPLHIIKTIRGLKMSVDYYRDSVFSKVQHYLEEPAQVAELVKPAGSRFQRARGCLKGLFYTSLAAAAVGTAVIVINPNGYGDKLLAELESLPQKVDQAYQSTRTLVENHLKK